MTDDHPQQTIRDLVPLLKQRTLDAYEATYRPGDLGSGPDLAKAGEIFARIDQAVAPWIGDLPDPKEIRQLLLSVRDATAALSLGPLSIGGQSSPTGMMGGFLKDIDDAVAKMSGETMDAYKAKFLSRLRAVITNQAGMTVPIGGALAAEEQLWYWALQDAASTVRKAYDAMDAAVRGGDVDWTLVLDVVGWALQGASLFAGGFGKAATDLGGIGVELLKGTAGKDDGKVEKDVDTFYFGTDWDELLKAFEEAMSRIGTSLIAEERELQKNIDVNVASMERNKWQYDLTNDDPSTPEAESGRHPDLTPDAQGKGVVINVDYGLTDGIIHTHMPGVVLQLEAAVKALNGAYVTSQLNRPPELGEGAGIWLNTLIFQLVKSVKDLAWEVDQGKELLRLVVKDYQEADKGTQRALDAHRRKMTAGSGYEPYS